MEIPQDIVSIMTKEYAVPELSEHSESDPELTLQTLVPENVQTPPPPPPPSQNNTTIEDFLKNTLAQLNLVRTLSSFQSEYLELSNNDQNHILNSSQNAILAENVALKFKFDQLQLQNEKIVDAAQKAKDQFAKLRSQRDYHKTKHRQVVQEKQVLVNDLRRLREHCQLYQPLIMELNARYDKLLRQKQLSDIAKDKAQNDLKKLQMQTAPKEEEITYTKRTAKLAPIQKAESTEKQLAKTYFKAQSLLESTNPYLAVENPENMNITRKFNKLNMINSPQKVHENVVSSVNIHRNRPVFLTASSDGSFKVLSSSNNQLLLQGSPHSSFITCAKFNPNSQFQSILASAAGDGTVKLFNILNQKEIASFEKIAAQAWWLDWNVEGRVLASAGADKSVRIFDVDCGKIIAKFEVNEYTNNIEPFIALRNSQKQATFCHFQPFGNLICTGGADKFIRVYDPRLGNEIHTYPMQNACKCVFDPSGTNVYGCDFDGNVLVQDIRMQKKLFTGKLSDSLNCVAAGPDMAVFGGKKGIYSYIGDSLKMVDKCAGISCESLDFQVSGNSFLFGCTDGSIGKLGG
ncbi:WD40 repeat protein [Spironucleus salmonicida]|uniref:Sperm-associated WD-repeat protein n=1 Tax=Spironucleus salmonicida TaxID=348837 RepID=V6LA71_9EUKA|nr:WD40 repeat protein [Spironucleus salmonicida]|eukprot:EST41320.1 Sperm-associated WD-repeat protein [Spironucleus salmonicida]